MKKVIIAAVCGLCLCAGAAVMSSADNAITVAGSGGDLHVRT